MTGDYFSCHGKGKRLYNLLGQVLLGFTISGVGCCTVGDTFKA